MLSKVYFFYMEKFKNFYSVYFLLTFDHIQHVSPCLCLRKDCIQVESTLIETGADN